MDFLKSVGGKLVGGLIALAVVAGGISWLQMDEASRSALLSSTGRIFAWFAIVLLLPWACFALIRKVAAMDSNGAGATLVLGLTGLEALVLAWLFGWSLNGAAAWVFASAAVLAAGVYNLFACDWIAEKVSGT